jgi:arsenite methyltransferase
MDLDAAVRERYSAAAREREPGLCCPVEMDPALLRVIPQAVLERDYGCGDPVSHVRPGETVLDLGCGGGKVCFIAAQVTGKAGRVIGVDVNDEMLALARSAQPEVAGHLGYANVEFRRGRIEDLRLDLDGEPLIADSAIDSVISNCVLNLVLPGAKQRMFAEIARVLRPGGRAVISDIVADRDVPGELASDPDLWSGCYSGALREDRFVHAFAAAGLTDVTVIKRDDGPWETINGVGFRSITVSARRPPVHPAVKNVYLFEDKGSRPSKVESLASFLRRRLDGTAEVTAFDLGRPTGQVPLPPQLRIRWQQGAACLPAMVVDSVVVTEGWVPNFRDAVQLIESGQPAPESMWPAAPAASSCGCGPGGC